MTTLPSQDEWKATRDPDQLGELFARFLSHGSEKDVPALTVSVWKDLEWTSDALINAVVDVLWFKSGVQESSAALLLVVSVLRSLKDYLPVTKLMETLDAQLLEAAGVISSQADLQKKLRLLNTQLYYRQDKFNLLVEESQGYSKYLVLLTTTTTRVGLDLDQVWQLIGTFRLDPNRCLDLLIDVLEQDGSRFDIMLPLARKLPIEKLPMLLGFKLSSGRTDVPVEPLLHCMTSLVQHQLLHLPSMMPFLSDDWRELLATLFREKQAQLLAATKEMAKVRLGGGGGGGSAEPTTAPPPVGIDVTGLQKAVVIQWIPILLSRDDWLVDKVLSPDEWSQLCVVLPQAVGGALCQWVGRRIECCYHHHCQHASIMSRTSGENEETVNTEEQSLDQVVEAISEPLMYMFESGCIHQCPILFTQLCRLLSACHQGVEMSEDVLELVQLFLLPSSSLFSANPALSLELWKVLDCIPYQQRYRMYTHWRGSGLERSALRSMTKPLWQITTELQASKDIKYHLKRLAKDTIRDASRFVAKICHVQPLVVFTTILGQIEAYDNMIQHMIDALRFVTPLALDVLSFCVLSRLNGSVGGMNRNRLKEDGIIVSQWLQSLETFTGALYKRYPKLELRGILCYLMSRLKDGHVMELGVLRILLKAAGGWAFSDYSPAASLSLSQLHGRAGTTLLKRETMSFGVLEDFNPRASTEIRSVLQDKDAGVVLLILLANLKHQVVFGGGQALEEKPIKLVGYLVDTCQVIMAILLDFLTSPHDEEDATDAMETFGRSLPSLFELFHTYKLDVAACWMVCRPLIRAVSAEVDDIAAASPLSKFVFDGSDHEKFKAMLPESAWSLFSVDAFELFFSHSLYDIFCPEDTYSAEINRLAKEEERVGRQQKSQQAPSSIRDGQAASVATGDELERLKHTVLSLSGSVPVQRQHVQDVINSVEDNKSSLFPTAANLQQSSMAFLCYCIYPRTMQGPGDALYCAYFIFMLHKMKTSDFATIQLLDAVFTTLPSALYGLTEGEAANVSILLSVLWTKISRWRYDVSLFDVEVKGSPGAIMSREKGTDSLTHSDFQGLYNKWHASIGSTALGCLQSTEYMYTRNSLIVLTRMVEVFPTRPRLGNKFLEALTPLQEESCSFADIRASAQAYSMQLVKARDEGVWIEEDAETVQARLKRDQVATAARVKRAAEQMEEIKRESAKITAEIGEEGRRGDRRRGPGDGRDFARSGVPRDYGRPAQGPLPSLPRDAGRRPETDSRKMEEARRAALPPPGRSHELSLRDDRRGPALREPSREDRPSRPRDRAPPRSDSPLRDRDDKVDRPWPRDRTPRPDSYTAIVGGRENAPGPPRDESSRRGGLAERWSRPDEREREVPDRGGGDRRDGGCAGSKRSRPTSPVEAGESGREDPTQSAKKARTGDDTSGATKDESSHRSDDRGRRSGRSSRHRGRNK